MFILGKQITWKNHIQLVENKASKNAAVLYQTSKLINSNCLRNIASRSYTLTLIKRKIHYPYKWIQLNENVKIGKCIFKNLTVFTSSI